MTEQPDHTHLIAAIAALGTTMTADPDHVPDEIGPEHIPDLCGILAALADRNMLQTEPCDDNRRRWAAGYIGFDHGREADAHVILGQLSMRMGLGQAVIGHYAAGGNGYAALAGNATGLACHLAMAAAQTADPDLDGHIDAVSVRALHRGARQVMRDLRGALDKIERDLKNGGYQL